MTTTWTNLAQQHGAKAAVSLTMSDEELETHCARCCVARNSAHWITDAVPRASHRCCTTC